jgi:hypothetical protein
MGYEQHATDPAGKQLQDVVASPVRDGLRGHDICAEPGVEECVSSDKPRGRTDHDDRVP